VWGWWVPDGSNVWVIAALFLLNFAIFLVAAVYIPRNRRPTTAVAWLLTIFLIPYLGFLLFLLFGTNRLSADRRRMQARMDDLLRQAAGGVPEVPDIPGAPPWLEQVARLARELTSIPMLEGNRIVILGSYDRTIKRIADEIDTARDHVHVMYYTLAFDSTTKPVFDALERAITRGVTVRVLYDHIGSRKYSGYRKMKARFERMGAEAHAILPIWPWRGGFQRLDLRNHRKLVVIDDRAAFIGSQNLIDRGYHKGRDLKWKDLMVMVEGPVVAAANAVFITDWYAETHEMLRAPTRLSTPPEHHEPPEDLREESTYPCQLIPSGPGYEYENNLRVFNELFYAATKRITIVSPYFVPDDSLLYAITTAAQRGVEVTVYAGEIGDQFLVYHAQRSYYDALLQAGVRIRLYQRPYILHSKHLTIDDSVTLIGSSNMDMRSFTLNAELMLLVHGREFVDRMREIENGYLHRSRELTLGAWRSRPAGQRALDNAARLTSVIQ